MSKQLPPLPATPVCIVDDDASVRDALTLLLRVEGYVPSAFADGPAFLESLNIQNPACLILDLRLPGLDGLVILRTLAARRFAAPVIVMSGQSDISSAVEAMKFGATDFVEKPFAATVMIERVREAVNAYRNMTAAEIEGLANFPGLHLLTGRERDVLAEVAHGASNKEAGRRLGISPRTVEVHRARIMDKLGARNAADLMRIVLSAPVRRMPAPEAQSLSGR